MMSYAGSRRSSQANQLANPNYQPVGLKKTAQKEPPRGPRPSEKIPVLQGTLPATFIPFNGDIVSQSVTPRDRVERLKRILETIDKQRVGVKENILWLFEREKERMIMEATEIEAELHLQDANFEIHPTEVDDFIRNMGASPQIGVDYNLKNAPLLNIVRPLPGASPRDLVINQLLNLAETGTREVKGYDDHIAAIRSFYEACLQMEIEKIEEAGLRPRKRIKVTEASM